MEKLEKFIKNQNDPDGIENMLNNYNPPVKVKNNISNTQENNNSILQIPQKQHTHNTQKDNTKKIYNKVATKFNFVVCVSKFLGYFIAIISLIILAQNNNFLMGLIVCVVICILTWFSTLIFEAISEGLQLLEDIKNKF